MGFEKYDKEKEAERGYGRLSLYIKLEALEKVRGLQKVLEDDEGNPLSKARCVEEAVNLLAKEVLGSK